jgi:hypothetical protein
MMNVEAWPAACDVRLATFPNTLANPVGFSLHCFSRETRKDCLIVFPVRPTVPPPLRPITIWGSQHLSASTAVVSLSSIMDRNPAGHPASLAAA